MTGWQTALGLEVSGGVGGGTPAGKARKQQGGREPEGGGRAGGDLAGRPRDQPKPKRSKQGQRHQEAGAPAARAR